MGLCSIFVRSTEKVTNPPHSRSKFLNNTRHLRYDRRVELKLNGVTEYHLKMGLAEGEREKKREKRSDRLHVIAPFSRDSRGSRLAPTSVIWYPGLTSGLCVNPRKSTTPPLSPFTNHIESEVENPAIPGCRWSWSGFNTLRGVRAAEIRVCFTQDVIWARSETVAILYFSKESSSARPGEVEHITLNIQGTEDAYAENPDGTVADKKIEEKEKKGKKNTLDYHL